MSLLANTYVYIDPIVEIFEGVVREWCKIHLIDGHIERHLANRLI